jgi:hypothetical protein
MAFLVGGNRLILVGEESLRRSVREFVAHYHVERNHQGLGNRLIPPLWLQSQATSASRVVSGPAVS